MSGADESRKSHAAPAAGGRWKLARIAPHARRAGEILQAFLRRVTTWYRRQPLPLRMLAIAAWAGVIWLLSSTPGGQAPPSVLRAFANNGGHLFLFGVFGSLVFLVLPGDTRARSAWAVAAALAFGVVDELHQGTVAGRSADPRDLVTDAVGAAWCAAALVWLERRDPRAARWCVWLVPAGLLATVFATL
jgi:VanZ family protein